MQISPNDITKDMIAYTMVVDKQSIKSLLRRNGIDLPSSASDKETIVAVLLASSKSPAFNSELLSILSKNSSKIKSDYASFAGNQFEIGTETDKMMFTGSKDFYNQIGYIDPKFGQGVSAAATKASLSEQNPVKTSGTKTKGKFFDWVKTNILTEENINAGLQLGMTALNNKMQKKQNQVQYEAADISQRQQELLSQQGQKPSPSFNVTTVAVVVVSVAIVGGIIYYFAKKK